MEIEKEIEKQKKKNLEESEIMRIGD